METVRERLRTLLIILLETLSDRAGGTRADRRLFRERAVAAGFDEDDVDELLDWLRESWPEGRPLPRRPEPPLPGVGVRCLDEEERLALSPEAFGYLLDLSHRRQITRGQMERLIHYAGLVAESPLGRREVADLVDRVLFGTPGDGTGPAGEAGRASHH